LIFPKNQKQEKSHFLPSYSRFKEQSFLKAVSKADYCDSFFDSFDPFQNTKRRLKSLRLCIGG